MVNTLLFNSKNPCVQFMRLQGRGLFILIQPFLDYEEIYSTEMYTEWQYSCLAF